MAKDKAADTFIIDCPFCRAKVAAIESGRGNEIGSWTDEQQPFHYLAQVGNCPRCRTLLVGYSEQLDFAEYGADYDRWSDIVRVHPKPIKTFISTRIPKVVKDSLAEADRCLQAGSPTAACVMLGRALEAIFHHLLKLNESSENE